ncbi:hypothetical protein ACFQ60_46545 [Streptomyces zhihengii]
MSSACSAVPGLTTTSVASAASAGRPVVILAEPLVVLCMWRILSPSAFSVVVNSAVPAAPA